MKAQDINLQAFLRFEPEHGRLLLGGRRMLIVSQRSFGLLEEVLGAHLGHEFTRALFAQFGYRCGADDYRAIAETEAWDSDADRLASGPVTHMWEGLVHVEPTRLEFDLGAGTLHMAGIWRNSYEADNYLAAHGQSEVPVCASLTGYASGWASAFLGRPCLAIETQCEGRGDAHCAFEIRPEPAWGHEANPWRAALSATGTSVARMLEQRVAERTRDLGDLTRALDHHAIVAITDPRGRIIFVNDNFCEVSGYAREELLGHDHRIVNSGTHDKAFFTDLWQTIQAGRVWHGEICNRAKDGRLYWVESTIYPVLGSDGRPLQYVSLRTDVSRRHRAESAARTERDRAARLALEAQRASLAKSEFLATMSHEIRTPMNGVLGFTELLLDTPLTDDQRLFVDTIRRSGESLLGIIDDILDFSKVEAGRMALEQRPFMLREVISDVVGLLTPRADRKGLELQAAVPSGDELALVGDAGRVRQVLLNLAGNAVKFTTEGRVTVSAVRLAGHVRVTVTDTGIGIPSEQLDRLFVKFNQADSSTTRRFGGTGLGLAISKQLVELMGGAIGVESPPGQGATFWFSLPDSSAIPAPAAVTTLDIRTMPGSGAAPARPLRVLVAEDNPVNQLLARRMLESLGHTVDVAADGSQAVQCATTLEYDVILMDCHMPVMDGFGASRTIRRVEASSATLGAARHVPILALTASVLETEREQCIEAGMDEVLAKPFTKEALAAAVVRWAARQ